MDYSLETDYSLDRIETDLFLQQAPVFQMDMILEQNLD